MNVLGVAIASALLLTQVPVGMTAAADPAAQHLVYNGTITVSFDPATPQPPFVPPPNPDATIVLDCIEAVCVASGMEGLIGAYADTLDLVFSGGMAAADLQMGSGGDLSYTCNTVITQPLKAFVGVTSLTIRVEPVMKDVGACHYVGAIIDFDGRLTSGDPCALTGRLPCPAVAAESGSSGERPAEPAIPGSVSRLSTGTWSAPSGLSALPTVGEAPSAPIQIVTNLLVTLILLLLVAFPTALLNSASETLAERVEAWRARRRPARSSDGSVQTDDGRDTPTPNAGVNWRRWTVAAATVLVAAVIAAFADPEFGFNPASVRVIGSIMVGFAIDVVLGWSVVVLLMRRFGSDRGTFEAKPITLLIVVGAVVLTRITGFEPGILFGVVAGVAFAGSTVLAKARPVLAALGWGFLLALLAWVAYSLLIAWGPTGDGLVFVRESLAAVAVAGVAALPIALVPLRGLPGHAIWGWNRWVWAGCYGVGLFAFFFVLMPMPSSWGAISWSLVGWVTAYLVYALSAVALWAIAARPWRRSPASAMPAHRQPPRAGLPELSGARSTDPGEGDRDG